MAVAALMLVVDLPEISWALARFAVSSIVDLIMIQEADSSVTVVTSKWAAVAAAAAALVSVLASAHTVDYSSAYTALEPIADWFESLVEMKNPTVDSFVVLNLTKMTGRSVVELASIPNVLYHPGAVVRLVEMSVLSAAAAASIQSADVAVVELDLLVTAPNS